MANAQPSPLATIHVGRDLYDLWGDEWRARTPSTEAELQAVEMNIDLTDNQISIPTQPDWVQHVAERAVKIFGGKLVFVREQKPSEGQEDGYQPIY